MSFAKNVVGTGVAPGAAAVDVVSVVKTGISAAGTTQGTATLVQADANLVSTASASQGVILYNGDVGDSCFVYNDNTGVGIYVYPPVGSTINGLTTNAGMVLPNNSQVFLIKVSATRWLANLSA